MGIIERNYATLTRSNQSANQIASDVLRLAPDLDRPEFDETLYQGEYLLQRGNFDFIIKAFITDEEQRPFGPTEGRPRFALGLTAFLLESLSDESTGFTSVPAQRLELESLIVEGGELENWVARRLEINLKRSSKEFPLRFRATFGEDDVIDITSPSFEPVIAVNALTRSFYSRYRIAELDPVNQGKLKAEQLLNMNTSDETGELANESYEYTDADAPDEEEWPRFEFGQ